MVINTIGKVSVAVVCAVAVMLLGLGGANSPILADTIVVPNAFETTEGGTPGPGGPDPRRVMQVFDGSQFATSEPVLITELALRPHSTQVGPSPSADHNLRMFFSTTSRSPATLSLDFADNIGADNTQVSFWETKSFDSQNLPGPGKARQFDIVLPLQTPFRYDPMEGNLLIEFQVGPPDSEAVSGVSINDLVVQDPNVNVVAALGSPTADGGDLLGFGFVAQFTVNPFRNRLRCSCSGPARWPPFCSAAARSHAQIVFVTNR